VQLLDNKKSVELIQKVSTKPTETVRKKAGYKRDAVTDALIQQSIVEFKERKRVVVSLWFSCVSFNRIHALPLIHNSMCHGRVIEGHEYHISMCRHGRVIEGHEYHISMCHGRVIEGHE